MAISGIGTGRYMGKTYEERLRNRTDKNAADAFQKAYAAKMEDAASYGCNVAGHQAGKSYVFDPDENGDVRHCTVADTGKITGPTKQEQAQFKAEQIAKRKRRIKYIQILEESAEKRKIKEQEDLYLLQMKSVRSLFMKS